MKDWKKMHTKRRHYFKQFKAQTFRRILGQRLWLQALIALVLGIAVGILLGPDAGFASPQTAALLTDWLALPGHLFLQLIKMIIIPLIFSSIVLGIVSSGSPEFLKRIGPGIAVYFLVTTTIAVTIGFGVANLIQPGSFFDTSTANIDVEPPVEGMVSASVPEQIVNVLPSNPLRSAVQGDMLGIVIFTIIFAIALLHAKRKQIKGATDFLETIQHISMQVVKWAMIIVPFAVFGLIAQVISRIGFSAIKGLGMYMLTVVAGLLVLLVFYMLIVWFVARRDPFKFLSAIKDVQILAFSTSSSAAAMPLSMKTAEEKLSIRQSIAEFIIPVGATVNMDGTALYQVVATVFLAQAFGVHLPLASLLLITAIAVGASIGAPATPGAGIIILATILESVGIPAAGLALILGVDRILDMTRTSVNVTGDLTACTVFQRRLEHLFDAPKAAAKSKAATQAA